MITYKKFQQALRIIAEYKKQLESQFHEVKNTVDAISPQLSITKESYLFDIEISVRLCNLLGRYRKDFGIEEYNMQLMELEKISISKFITYRGVGKKAVNELKEICIYAGITLQK